MTLLAGVLPVLRGLGADLSATLARAVRGTRGDVDRPPSAAGLDRRPARAVVRAAGQRRASSIQTFVRLRAVDPGFDAAGRMTLSYFAPRARYADAGRLVALVDRVREEIGRAPGVRAVGIAQALPFAPGVVWLQALTRDDPRGVANLGALPHVHYNVVSAGYAEALGVPIKAGRTFDATDTAGSLPVVVINEALARRFFPGQDPIGQTLSVGHAQALPTLPRRTIVGVVGDARWSGLDEPAGPEAWVPYAQQAGTEDILRTMYVVFHAAGDAEAAMPAVRAQVARADADLPLTSVRTLGSRVDEAVWRQRLAAAALGALGIAALAVALMGVLAVTSYLVGRRSHEMGVRLALGARPRAIVRLVLVESGWLVLLGTGLGVARRARDGAPALDDALRRRRPPTRRPSPRPAPRSPRPRSPPAICRRGGRRGSIRWSRCDPARPDRRRLRVVRAHERREGCGSRRSRWQRPRSRHRSGGSTRDVIRRVVATPGPRSPSTPSDRKPVLTAAAAAPPPISAARP